MEKLKRWVGIDQYHANSTDNCGIEQWAKLTGGSVKRVSPDENANGQNMQSPECYVPNARMRDWVF
jgi:hypothetical protein